MTKELENLRQKLLDCVATLDAIERGEPWEYQLSNGMWIRPQEFHSVPGMIAVGYHCRPAPKQPSPQYWSKPEHVPGPGPIYVRWVKGPQPKSWTMILAVSNEGITCAGSNKCCETKLVFTAWEDIDEHEYSRDLKAWHLPIVPDPAEPLHKPHNPAGLTPEQVEVEKGYRLLDGDEIRGDGYVLDSIEVWHDGRWDAGYYGSNAIETYRTRDSREELAKNRRRE